MVISLLVRYPTRKVAGYAFDFDVFTAAGTEHLELLCVSVLF